MLRYPGGRSDHCILAADMRQIAAHPAPAASAVMAAKHLVHRTALADILPALAAPDEFRSPALPVQPAPRADPARKIEFAQVVRLATGLRIRAPRSAALLPWPLVDADGLEHAPV